MIEQETHLLLQKHIDWRIIMNYTIMVLTAYAVIMIAATVLMTNKEKNVERFCVGNRNTG